MNERIRQFARESHLDVYALGLDKVKWEATLEKFAELIIEECMDIAYDHTPNSEECEYKRLIHNKIRQHFGVEE